MYAAARLISLQFSYGHVALDPGLLNEGKQLEM